MKLLRVGKWREAKKDQLLAIEDRPIDDVKLIYNGLVNVESKGEIVAQLRDGSFIGEISFLRGGDATATVRAERPTRYLSWSKEELNKLLNRNPSMRFAMQAVISTDLTKKLVR
jgi:CRP-like cAMP-binding protein